MGTLVVLITLVLSLPAGDPLARLDRRWAGPMGIAIFLGYPVPPTLLFLALFRIVVGVIVFAVTPTAREFIDPPAFISRAGRR